MEVNEEALAKLSLADLIAIVSRSGSFYGLEGMQWVKMTNRIKEEIQLRLAEVFIF